MGQIEAVLISLLVPCTVYLAARWFASYTKLRVVQTSLNSCTFGYILKESEVRVSSENLYYEGNLSDSFCERIKYRLLLGDACYVARYKYKLDDLVIDTEDSKPSLYFTQDYKYFDKYRYRLKPTPLYRVYFSLNRLSEYFIDVDNPQPHELNYVRMVLPKEELKLYKEFKND